MKLLLLLSIILTPLVVFSQRAGEFYQKSDRGQGHFFVRAGINHSNTTVSAELIQYPVSIGGVTPRTGYYIGGGYILNTFHDYLSFRLDAMFQSRGVASTVNNRLAVTSRYYFIGFAPQVGLTIAKNFSIYSGVEVNHQFMSINRWGTGFPFEFGTCLRATYSIGRWAAEVGLFKGFSKYDLVDLRAIGSTEFYFYNQNVQAGLLYSFGRN